MNSDEFDQQMRSLEYFHGLRCLPGAWIVLRLDGRGFTKFTEKQKYEKPFDPRFRDLMIHTSHELLEEMQAIYAYTESDEISLLFRREWGMFDREVEKIVSVSAAMASSTFTHACSQPVQFDSRIWLGATDDQVVDYFRWRQSDAARCAINGWSYWTLRKEGKTARQATHVLDGQGSRFKIDLLSERGIPFESLPGWQMRGIGLYWEAYEKVGYNPHLEQEVIVQRRQVKIDDRLLAGDAYGEFLRNVLAFGKEERN
jgi:tRNA(His) 5'-end guanylyltransferase